MRRGGWCLVVAVVLGWGGCGSSTAKAPFDGSASHDASVATDVAGPAPDGTDAADVAGDTASARDGASDAVSDRADAQGAGAATWSGIYGDLLTNPGNPSNCMGSSCHDPGIQKGIDLSTAAKGFTTLQSRIVPGQPNSSSLYTHLASGSMPLGKPHFSDTELARVRAWILAGALDN